MKIDLDELEKLAKDAIDIREATKHWTDTKRVHCVPTPETILELIRQNKIMRDALSYVVKSQDSYVDLVQEARKALEQVEGEK